MTIQCCKCRKIEAGKEWILLASEPEGDVSHTYCPTCHGEELAVIRRQRRLAPEPA